MYTRRRSSYMRRPRGRSINKLRLLMAVGVLAFALISFLGSKEYNPVTGENQYVSLTPSQEIALGLQAAPQMIRQHGGEVPDRALQEEIDRIGFALVRNSIASDRGWQFEFTLLNDPQTVNAFALPGGQVFLTTALYNRLETEGQLAGVLGHEIGHVLARHSAQRIAKDKLTKGVIGAVAVGSETYSSAQMAQMVGNLVNMRYGRDDELQSDQLGVKIMAQTGYDPRALIGVMEILEEAAGGATPPEFMSTHPSPDNRIGRIQDAIAQEFPNGVPSGLIP